MAPEQHDPADSADTSADTSPLGAAVAGLQVQVNRAIRAGDLATARALHAAIGGLLAAASDTRQAAGVVDLATRRK